MNLKIFFLFFVFECFLVIRLSSTFLILAVETGFYISYDKLNGTYLPYAAMVTIPEGVRMQSIV